MGNNYKNNKEPKAESVVEKIEDDKIVDDLFYDDEIMTSDNEVEENSKNEDANNEEKSSAVDEVKSKRGRVVNCVLLNLRKEPSLDADVVDTLKEGCGVTITEREDTDDFYEVDVIGKSNCHGFCMKKWIQVIE